MKIGQKFREYTLRKVFGWVDNALKGQQASVECHHAGCTARFETFVALFKHQRDSHRPHE